MKAKILLLSNLHSISFSIFFLLISINVKMRYCIYSDNDHIVPLQILKKHVENVKGIGYMIPNIGHMGRKSNLQTIPKVIEIIKEVEN